MMALPTLDDYILARAAEAAARDGDVLGTLYIVAAANTLQTELFAARDRILAAPPVPMIVAGAAHVENVVPAPEVQAAELAVTASPDVTATGNEAASADLSAAPAVNAAGDDTAAAGDAA